MILTGCSHCGSGIQTRNEYSGDFVGGVRQEYVNAVYGEYTKLAVREFIIQNVPPEVLEEYNNN